MAVHKGAWTKRVLAIPPWATPRTLLTSSEAAKLLGVPRSTLYRMRLRGRGDGPTVAEGFSGNAVRYRVVNLLAFWGRVTGDGPADFNGVWEQWIAEGRNLKEHRRPPGERGLRPRGVRARRWKQMVKVQTRNELLWARYVIAALDADHPEARRELLDMAHEEKASART